MQSKASTLGLCTPKLSLLHSNKYDIYRICMHKTNNTAWAIQTFKCIKEASASGVFTMSLACFGARLAPQVNKTATSSHAPKQPCVDATLASYSADGVLLWNPHGQKSDAVNRNTRSHDATNCSYADCTAPRLSTFTISMLMALSYISVMLLIVYLSVFCMPDANASAASAGSGLPYEVWLSALQRSATGPIAFTIALLGIIGCGATLIFAGGEISRFMRSIIYIILVMTLLLGANSLMTNFFNGASINPPVDAKSADAKSSSQNATEKYVPVSSHKAATSTGTFASDSDAAAAAALNESAKPAVDPRAPNGSDPLSLAYNSAAYAKQAQDMARRELKPSVFAQQRQSSANSSHDLIVVDEALEELRQDFLAINPDLTYEEHIDRFISGLIDGYGMDSSNQSNANNSNTQNTDKYKHPSVFVPKESVYSTHPYFDKTLSALSEVYDLNSYQSSPLPVMNNELTVKMSQGSNGDLELQLFEFSSRTLKGFMPSHLDLKDSRLSWIAPVLILFLNLIFFFSFVKDQRNSTQASLEDSSDTFIQTDNLLI